MSSGFSSCLFCMLLHTVCIFGFLNIRMEVCGVSYVAGISIVTFRMDQAETRPEIVVVELGCAGARLGGGLDSEAHQFQDVGPCCIR